MIGRSSYADARRTASVRGGESEERSRERAPNRGHYVPSLRPTADVESVSLYRAGPSHAKDRWFYVIGFVRESP
jgi:hypothetical protein